MVTYKRIVKMLVEQEANAWLKKVLKENKVEYLFLSTSDPTMEIDKEIDSYLWEMKAEVYMDRYLKHEVIVGGTVDDLCGVCCSVIWNNGKKDTIWMAVPKIREALEIKEFKLN